MQTYLAISTHTPDRCREVRRALDALDETTTPEVKAKYVSPTDHTVYYVLVVESYADAVKLFLPVMEITDTEIIPVMTAAETKGFAQRL